MTPTETLKHEHRIVLLVLKGAEDEVQFIRQTGGIHADKVGQMVDFFRNFVDRCHHTKEEAHLFVKMRERGAPKDGGPLAVMLAEHDEGRRTIAAISQAMVAARAGEIPAIEVVGRNLLSYVELLRAHSKKEDTVLYPMADAMLTARDQEALAGAFEQVEAEEMGTGVHDKYHRLAHDLGGVDG